MKIIGIGVDQIERARVLKACEKESFLRRCYSPAERALIEERPSRAATNFAGKEAVAKAFGTGFRRIKPDEIEILRRESSAPYVRLVGNAERIAQEKGIQKIDISLSDSKTMAIAFVVATGKDGEEGCNISRMQARQGK